MPIKLVKRSDSGRPNKYADLLLALKDDELYTAAKIADFALDSGYIKEGSVSEQKKLRNNIRLSLGKYATNHRFPRPGDGLIKTYGQAPSTAWFGKRWKEPIQKKSQYQEPKTKGESDTH